MPKVVVKSSDNQANLTSKISAPLEFAKELRHMVTSRA